MMKRILLALALLVGLSAPAYAVELNADTGCDNAGAWMLGTGWTVTGSKCVGTGVNRMQMLMQNNAAVKKGHRYKLTFTMSAYSAGQVRGFVGVTMPSAPTGSYVLASSVTDIADNFTTANGLTSGLPVAANPGTTPFGHLSAFRTVCTQAAFGWVDPLVYPGIASPHLHGFYGNTAVGKSWNYSDFRAKGSSSCGNQKDPKYPLNRSGYWVPAMLDGLGNLIKPSMIQLYYKGPAAAACAFYSPTNDCQNVHAGIRFTFGYKSSNQHEGPMDPASGVGNYECWASADGSVSAGPATGTYLTMADMVAAGCPAGALMHLTVAFPSCWDGVNVDSPDHRSHMAYPTGTQVDVNAEEGICPNDHPVKIPDISIQAFYPIDAAFVAGKWRLASDEMASGCYNGTTVVAVVAGCTLHADYWEAWSPTVRATWYTNCELHRNSCSSGDLGDGTGVHDGGGLNYDGTPISGNGHALSIPNRWVPLTLYGMSKDYSANGTYSVEMVAPADGNWGLMGLNGFSGSLDNISFTEIAHGSHGSVTVHN